MDVSVFLPSFQIAIVRCACQLPLAECTVRDVLMHLGCTWACICLKRRLVECWLCVFWHSRWVWGGRLSTPQVPRLCLRQLRVLRRRRDWHAALLLTASAGTSAGTLCTSEEEGLAPSTFLDNVDEGRVTGTPPYSDSGHLGGEGTGPPPHNAGEYFGGREQVLFLKPSVITTATPKRRRTFNPSVLNTPAKGFSVH